MQNANPPEQGPPPQPADRGASRHRGRWLGLAILAGLVALALAVPPGSPVPSSPQDVAAPPPLTGEIHLFERHGNPRAVPDIAFTDGEGRPLVLEDFRGRVVLVNFWATWCAPCRYEMPSLDRLQGLRGGRDFAVLALSMDRQGMAVVQPFFESLELRRLETYLDPGGMAARGFGVTGLPTTILIDAEGREAGRLAGPAEWDAPEAVALIDDLIARIR